MKSDVKKGVRHREHNREKTALPGNQPYTRRSTGPMLLFTSLFWLTRLFTSLFTIHFTVFFTSMRREA